MLPSEREADLREAREGRRGDGRTASTGLLRFGLFVFAIGTLVCLPFLIVGEGVFLPVFETLKDRAVLLTVATAVLLGLDAVLPVPSAWVIVFLAQQAGVAAGIAGGAVGLCAGVASSIVVGRVAVGRLAPKFVPEVELERMRQSMQRHAILTLACLRSVPVFAETSVMIAAATGVPASRIFLATSLPNLAIAVVYSVAADDSLLAALLAFLGTIGVSYLSWRGYAVWEARRNRGSPA